MTLWKSAVCLIGLSLGFAGELLAQTGDEEIPNWTIPGFEMDGSALPEADGLRSVHEQATLTVPSSFVGVTPAGLRTPEATASEAPMDLRL